MKPYYLILAAALVSCVACGPVAAQSFSTRGNPAPSRAPTTWSTRAPGVTKKLAAASHPRRDDQFRHITELRERCAADNVPVISVDTKKKELVGAFRNPGAKWTPHHFASCIFASSSVRGRLLRSTDPGM